VSAAEPHSLGAQGHAELSIWLASMTNCSWWYALVDAEQAVDRSVSTFPAYGGSDHVCSLKAVCRYLFLPGAGAELPHAERQAGKPKGLLDETAQIGMSSSNC